MESHKEINRALTHKNLQLKSLISRMQKELLILNKQLMVEVHKRNQMIDNISSILVHLNARIHTGKRRSPRLNPAPGELANVANKIKTRIKYCATDTGEEQQNLSISRAALKPKYSSGENNVKSVSNAIIAGPSTHNKSTFPKAPKITIYEDKPPSNSESVERNVAIEERTRTKDSLRCRTIGRTRVRGERKIIPELPGGSNPLKMWRNIFI